MGLWATSRAPRKRCGHRAALCRTILIAVDFLVSSITNVCDCEDSWSVSFTKWWLLTNKHYSSTPSTRRGVKVIQRSSCGSLWNLTNLRHHHVPCCDPSSSQCYEFPSPAGSSQEGWWGQWLYCVLAQRCWLCCGFSMDVVSNVVSYSVHKSLDQLSACTMENSFESIWSWNETSLPQLVRCS